MGDVIPMPNRAAKKPESETSDLRLLWVCRCGWFTWKLLQSGYIECANVDCRSVTKLRHFDPTEKPHG